MKRIILFSAIVLIFFLNQAHVYPGIKSRIYKKRISALKVKLKIAKKSKNREAIKKQCEELEKICAKVIESPDIEKKLKFKALKTLAEVKQILGKEEEALIICDKLLKENRKNKKILKMKAVIYRKIGDKMLKEKNYDEAIDYYKRMCDIDITPSFNAFNKSVVATAYIKAKNYKEAEKWLKKIIVEHKDLLNWPACATMLLASIYESKKEYKKAKQLYRKIIKDYSNSDWVEKAKKNLKRLEKNEK